MSVRLSGAAGTDRGSARRHHGCVARGAAGGGRWGHPVMSIWPLDVIHYGADLLDYLDREFDIDVDPNADPKRELDQSVYGSGSSHATAGVVGELAG